jgi:uncharacterized zinc-type alcohol dehydrogenase-like protein
VLGQPGPNDVDIRVTVCALCHSDLHLLDGDWSSARFPLVPGHEIVGRVHAIGANVTDVAVGDRVGVGWQCGACFACPVCFSGREHLCPNGKVRTCVGRPGGLADIVRTDRRFCFAIPAELDDAEAAPLLCAGVTVFSPLSRRVTRPDMRVGVIGVGGLGHLAIQFARALGARVTAFDPDATKEDDARQLGAAGFRACDTRAPIAVRGSYDLLLSTTHAALDWDSWMSALDLGGTLCLTGVPPSRIGVEPDHLLDGEKSLTGSVVGSPSVIRETLRFAAAQGVRPRVERMGPRDAETTNRAFARLRRGDARYRIVLLNDRESQAASG